MFRPLDVDTPRQLVALKVEGRTIYARDGDTIALALLEAGLNHTRTTPVLGSPARAALPNGSVFRVPRRSRRSGKRAGLHD